jgi:hypothetical protein
MAEIKLPDDVVGWLRNVFYECNARVTQKLCNNPNLPEESLDLTWIEHLSQFSSPVTLKSSCTVRIETHYLGGLRHFLKWEVADIGVLLFIKRAGRIERSKVALLQSKRLYPSTNQVIEEGKVDYEIGFARIADPEDLARSIAVEAEFEFNEDCQYGALIVGSDQVKAIDAYERENNLSVYYQLYNPRVIPFVQRIPLSAYGKPHGKLSLGTRVLPAKTVHRIIGGQAKGYRPTAKVFANVLDEPHVYGWCLEHFIVDLLLGCYEGSQFGAISDERIQNLFYRRSGPIAAAITITIEASEADG